MSLENSQYTFHSLQGADRASFQREVDRITKEADHVEEDQAVPPKRGRYTNGDSGTTPRRLLNQQDRVVSGIVVEVTMEDFLCHSNMTVKLNKNITFIVGRNGSGKSAVLTALVVALGGNASNTGRGAALKDFVRHNCPSARVTCVISNAGPINFKRELYGDTITIVRTIQSQGGSSIRLKSDKGKVISSKMEDLRNMTLALGIQVDNPISVLDQNTARHFLNQSKPTDKFDLFMRATNLETLQHMFVEISMYLDKTKQELSKKERQFVENNAELLEARKKYEMVLSLDKDRAKITTLKMELLWAQVRDTMNALANKQKDLKKVQKEKGNLDSSVSTEAEAEPLLGKIESSKAEIRVLETEVKEIDSELKEIKLNYSLNLARQKKFDQEKINITKTLVTDERTIKEYRDEIRSQEQKMLPEHVDRRRKQREEIRELMKSLEDFEAKRASLDAEVKALQSNANGIIDAVEQMKRRKRFCEDEIRKLNTQLQGLETEESNLSVFGPSMPALMRQIEGCRQWHKKPVGPLGSYVRVKDPKWTLAVESVLGARLFTFVVETLEDQRRLQQMIRQTITKGAQPSVIRFSCPTQPYDTSRTTSRTPEYSNVLDVVEISNPVARNMLVDLCRLESILLIPTDNECFALLEEVRSVPRNCVTAYTMKGDSYFPAPNFRSYGGTRRNAHILQTSRDDLIRETRQRLQESESKLQIINQELFAAAHEKASNDTQVRQRREAARVVNVKFLETQTRLESLKDIEQPDTNSVSVLKEELVAKEQELHAKRQKLEEFPAKLKAVENEREVLKQAASDKDKKRSKINQHIVALQRDSKRLREQIDELHSAQASKKRKLEKVKELEEKLKKECEELLSKHKEISIDAQKLEDHYRAEEVEKNADFESLSSTRRPVQSVDQEIRTLSKRLASVEKTLGQNLDNFQKEFHEKVKVYNNTKKYIESLKKNSAFLRHALDERRSLYHTQKKLTCGVVSHQFTRVLRFRNCTGNVKINFEKRTLEITVGPIDEGERSGKGTTSLSGGERSYATMAFVIALWNVTELPFYFLDEFDVFMDMLNRQTVLTLLLRFAKQKKGYQFGFLTPLDTTNVKNSDKVLVLKLDDPRND